MTVARKKSQPPTKPVRRKRPMSTRAAIARIDALVRELESLRRQLDQSPKPPPAPAGLTDSLYGIAGTGHPAEYDLDLDWTRFSQWPGR